MEKKARAIIMTVGLQGDQGGDVLDALQLDLDALKPEMLALVASGQSMANARRMIERSGLPAGQCEIVELTGAHDIDEVFRKTNDLIQRLIKRGYGPDEIAINYTSGTKVMGSGAVLSAVYNKVMELRYITGLASVREGPGKAHHRILTTKPGAVFAYQQMLNGRSMLLDLRFRSAFTVLEEVEDDLLTPEDRKLRLALVRLTRAYGEWDNFYPDRFLSLYSEVRFEFETLDPFRMHEGQLDVLRKTADEILHGQPGPFIITDLYNNASRRLMLGRTEDALSRLYRALEMLGQWVLAREFGIDTNNVDTRGIPPRDRVSYEALRSIEDGTVKIGFRKAYELLGIFNVPVGVAFKNDPLMREFLEKRTDSILAHGLHPAGPNEGQNYMIHAADLFKMEIPTFDELSRNLQFPWLLDPKTPRPEVQDMPDA